MIRLGVRRAFVSASAAAIGLGVGHAMTFPHSHWSVITALTLMSATADGTVRRTLWRVLGTIGCALGVVAAYGAADPQPEWIIGVSLVALLVGYTAMHYTRARYAALLFLPLGAGFGLEALTDPTGAPALVAYRAFFISLGAVLVWILSALFRCQVAPASAPPPPPLSEAVLHALRLTLASVLAMFLAVVIERAELAPLMVITVLVLGTVTTAPASRGVAVLRFGGALGGGLIAVAFYILLLDQTTGIWSLMLVVFVVTWFCALLMGIPSLSYLGVQIGFVFAWSIGDGPAPTGDIWIPLERMVQVGGATLTLMGVYRLTIPSRWLGPRRLATPN